MSTLIFPPTLPSVAPGGHGGHGAAVQPWFDGQGVSMVYTDGVHLVAATVPVLHAFAEAMGLKRCWYHGLRKGHPHYDLTTVQRRIDAYALGARKVSSRWIVEGFKNGTLKARP